jgi:hypothetical protein
MARRTIAPTLRLVVEALAEEPLPHLCEDWQGPAALREMRAVFAVARTAVDAFDLVPCLETLGVNDPECGKCGPCRFQRALARLDRLSRPRAGVRRVRT